MVANGQWIANAVGQNQADVAKIEEVPCKIWQEITQSLLSWKGFRKLFVWF